MSALVDAAFAGAGKSPGMELWRIENKVPVKISEVSYPCPLLERSSPQST